MKGQKMVNKKHKDYPKYAAEFKTLVEERNSELSKIKVQTHKGFDGENSIVEKKYALKIKALQEKYNYLFD